MSQLVSIQIALHLPVPDIEGLIQGRTIAALPRIFIRPGQRFALCPANSSNMLLPFELYYRSSFLPIAQTALNQLNSETVSLQTWAKCELCQILDGTEDLETISQLSVWTKATFQEILTQQQHIFLAYLRVYQLIQPCEIQVTSDSQKIGKFIGLPASLTVTEAMPVLSDRIFSIRKHQLENYQPPPHSELEELLDALTQLNNSSTQQLEHDIKSFLGWTSEALTQVSDSQPAWINTIAELGDRSQELDEKKSNYQAGTDFENIVRDSLEFLGFTVDEAYKGGAGGLDLFCSKPYPLVGECKAGKSIPSRSAEELIKLGGMRLDEAQFQAAAKLIIGPGKPSKDVLTASQKFRISIINPMTLQKLVEFQAKYPGSVNLIEFKKYLEPGQIDDKFDQYIETVLKDIKLRSHLVQLVRNYLQNTGMEATGVDALHGAYFGSNPPQPLKTAEMHEILIELSSPLTGYLGRIKGSNSTSDRFYFLRNLPIE